MEAGLGRRHRKKLVNLPFGDPRNPPFGRLQRQCSLATVAKRHFIRAGPTLQAACTAHAPRPRAPRSLSPGLQSGIPGRQPRRSPGRAPRLLVAQESLLAPQHLPQLRQTPQPQVLGSLGLEAAEQRGHHEVRAAVGSEAALARRQAPLLAPDPRPPMPLSH